MDQKPEKQIFWFVPGPARPVQPSTPQVKKRPDWRALAIWLDQSLAKLETEFADFQTARSLCSFLGR